jgi:hypothetical protein
MEKQALLLIGGYGVTGREVAKLLRSRHPDLPLTIAGRNLEKATALADSLGGARSAAIDLADGRMGLDQIEASIVAVFAKDAGLDALSWAHARAIPYFSISSAAFEHGVDAVHALARVNEAPVVLAGHWFAGALTIAVLALSARFDTIETIVAGVTIDRNASGGGAAAIADFERVARCMKTTLSKVNGTYTWLAEDETLRRYRAVGGTIVEGKGAVSIDVASIGARTSARNIHVLETWGQSHLFTLTGTPADEISIEVVGTINGEHRFGRQTLQLSNSVTTLTALCIALTLERLIGLDGHPPASPGVYTPDQIMAPEAFLAQLQLAGAEVVTTIE